MQSTVFPMYVLVDDGGLRGVFLARTIRGEIARGLAAIPDAYGSRQRLDWCCVVPSICCSPSGRATNSSPEEEDKVRRAVTFIFISLERLCFSAPFELSHDATIASREDAENFSVNPIETEIICFSLWKSCVLNRRTKVVV